MHAAPINFAMQYSNLSQGSKLKCRVQVKVQSAYGSMQVKIQMAQEHNRIAIMVAWDELICMVKINKLQV